LRNIQVSHRVGRLKLGSSAEASFPVRKTSLLVEIYGIPIRDNHLPQLSIFILPALTCCVIVMPQSSLLKWLSTDKESTKIEKPTPALQESQETHEESGLSSAPKPVDHEKEAIHGQQTAAKPNSNKPSRPLPSNIELRACSKDDIPALKRITSLLLPIPYPEKFFREILDDPVTNDLTLVAIWRENRSSDPHETSSPNNPSGDDGGGKATLIGAIRCRLLSSLPGTTGSNILGDEAPMLYLSTLVLLSPYR
jgi:hypothetical protein